MRHQLRLEFRCDTRDREDALALIEDLKQEIDAKFKEDSDDTNPPEWIYWDAQQVYVPEPQQMKGLNIPILDVTKSSGQVTQYDDDPGDCDPGPRHSGDVHDELDPPRGELPAP